MTDKKTTGDSSPMNAIPQYESADVFRSTIEQATDGFLLTDETLNIVEWNLAMEAIFGQKRSEMVGKPLVDFLLLTMPPERRSPGDRERLQSSLSNLKSPPGKEWMSRPQEAEVVDKNGERKSVLITTYPVFSGPKVFIGAFMRDISERKKLEIALHENEKMLKKAQELAEIGHFRYDPATSVVEGSEVLFRIFGLTREEFGFESFVNAVHPDDRAYVASTIGNSAEKGLPYDIEHWLLCRNGSEKFVHAIGEPEKNSEGKTVRLIGTVQDITGRKLAEQALRVSKERYRSIVENMNDGLLIQDFNGVIFECNDNACRMLGYDRNEMIGMNLRAIGAPETLPRLPRHVEEIQANGKALFDSVLVRKGGGRVAVNVSARLVSMKGNGIIQSFVRDITDRKKTEDALRASEERYRSIVENMNDTLFFIDFSGTILDCNDNAYRMLGYDRNELVGSKISKILPPEEAQKTSLNINAIMQAGSASFDTEDVRKDGSRGAANISARVISREGNGRIMSIVRDITERKRAEHAIIQAKNEWEKTFNAMSDLIMIVDRDFHVVRMNRTMEKRLGAQAGAGLLCHEIVHGLNCPHGSCPHRQLLTDGKEHAAECYEERLSGYFRVNVSPLFDEQGALSGSVHVMRDITVRKLTEDRLRASEEMFAKAFNSSPASLVISDLASGKLIDVNKAFLALAGYKWGEIVGRTAAELGLWVDSKIRDGIIGKIKNNSGAKSIEVECRSKSGLIKTLLVSGEIIAWQGVSSLLISGMDISERKKNEENQAKSEKIEALGHLAGGVAHDFNNLLGGIFGYLDMAREKLDEGKIDRVGALLDKALAIFNKAKGLTNQFVTFAKGGAPVKAAGDLDRTLRDNVGFALSGSNVRSEFSLAEDLWECEFDEHQIGQVIDNLTINARQAMEKGGTLSVRAENAALDAPMELSPDDVMPAGRYIKITFTDTGPGIPKELHRKVFDPFFTTKKRGTGLGLATVYSIVKKHDGHLLLESEPGKGATFTVWLPAGGGHEVKGTLPEAKMAIRAETPLNGRPPATRLKGRILTMDDEESMRDMASNILAKLGCKVSTAKNGEEAIKLFTLGRKIKKPFDAVVLDLTVVGGMGGKETAEKLLAIDPDIRLIVSSGYSEDPVMARPEAYGFVASVPKPYTKEEMAEVVGKVLEMGNAPRPPQGE